MHLLLVPAPSPGGIGIPSPKNESHAAKAGQAIKFLADTRDPYIREVALDQLTEMVAKRSHYLDPNKVEHLAEFFNSSAPPREGRAGAYGYGAIV